MLSLLLSGLRGLVVALFAAPALAAENLALRQQLAVLERQALRPRLRCMDRVFWVALRWLWSGWRDALVLVRPETVIRWHRRGFRIFWTWKSRRARGGRPRTDAGVRVLIREMVEANPTWGAPRIHGELLMLGLDVSERTVARWMPRSRKPPSQTWRTFLDNHVQDIASTDFFVVPTATFHVLYVLVTLLRKRHLLRLLKEYVGYDNESRTHLSLGKDSPSGREVQGPELGEVVAIPQVGGLHHRYERCAA